MSKIKLIGYVDSYFLHKLNEGFKPLSDNFERWGRNHCKDKEQRTIPLSGELAEQQRVGLVRVSIIVEIIKDKEKTK